MRAAYARALAQRNAALARVRAGRSAPATIDPWDAELARHGIELMRLRAETTDAVAAGFARHAAELGLPEPAELAYAPRSRADEADGLRDELAERRGSDLERGFTGHGPHRDDLVLRHGGRLLRSYGSQGQQRVGLLALLFAERDVLLAYGSAPIMLLDDVTSELDLTRRERLADLVRAGGQAVISATELAHVPGATDADVVRVEVDGGRLVPGLPAATGGRVRRLGPRGLEPALGGLMAQLRPATTLARVQEAWPRAVGPALSGEARPVSERARNGHRELRLGGLGPGAPDDVGGAADEPQRGHAAPRRGPRGGVPALRRGRPRAAIGATAMREFRRDAYFVAICGQNVTFAGPRQSPFAAKIVPSGTGAPAARRSSRRSGLLM